MTIKKKIASRTLVVFYALIMMEGILMATPFGLFLYSFYLPILDIARKSYFTAWTAAFFLPHSVYATDSTFIEFIRWKGPHLIYIGLLGFFIFAFQVYYSKFKRKGVVNNFVYSYIRHPQYLFLILSGIGFIFIWPRMMMLILLTVMSIIYYYLAKFEERNMQTKHPEYSEYIKKTAMFIPGNPGGKLYKLVFGKIPYQKVAHVITIVIVIALIFSSAVGLRNLTVSGISSLKLPNEKMVVISIYPKSEKYMRDVVIKTLANSSIKHTLAIQGNVSYTVHILPRDYGMVGMFAEINNQQEITNNLSNYTTLRNFIWGTESEKVKVVFSKIDKPDKKFVPVDEIMDMSAKMTPVLVAELNIATGNITKVTITPTTHYGEVPQPIF